MFLGHLNGWHWHWFFSLQTQRLSAEHLPQLLILPQPSLIKPQFMPIFWQSIGTGTQTHNPFLHTLWLAHPPQSSVFPPQLSFTTPQTSNPPFL
jgi:hypothetical protein